MPWQRQVIGGATEMSGGRMVYRQVGVTVPRQSGKTSMTLVLLVACALSRPDTRIIYSAQTRLDARRTMLDEWWPKLERSKLAPLVTARRGAGSESLWFRNDSRISLVSSTAKAGHGQTLDLVVLDEAWAQADDRLEQALRPAMMTRLDPQLWVVSTAGIASSTYLRTKVNDGRARAEMGVTDTACYFEWSAADDADPSDPVTWQGCMPALDRKTQLSTVRADFELMALPEFRRAYLNQWPEVALTGWAVISKAAWDALRARPVANGQVALAADVTPSRDAGAIAVAWRRPDGLMDVELIEHRRGTGWMAPRITAIVRKHRPVVTVIDATGPASSLLGELEAAGVEVTRPLVRDLTAACGLFYDMATDSRTLRHGSHEGLDAALAGAVRRDLGDGWAWARRKAVADISPLVAATLAVWGHDKFGRPRFAPYNLIDSVK
jgi:phage terminase large subunit-like protein